MIIQTDLKLKPGEIVKPKRWTDKKGIWQETHPFYVIREATREEFLASVPEWDDPINSLATHFYEVSTD